MKSTGSYFFAWLAAAGLAFVLAFAAPNESRVMGRLPAFMAQTLDHQQLVAVPAGLHADRTLALITFQKDKRGHIDSWIQGLNLKNDPSIAWLRMPVLNDPGNAAARSAVESKLLRRYPEAAERAKLVPVFADKTSFIRSAGLGSTDQVYAVVVNREGEVLARAEGHFDADKAQALRETLLAQNLQGAGAQGLTVPSVK